MTTASHPFVTALWRACFAGDWPPSCYTTWGDTTLLRIGLKLRRGLGEEDIINRIE